MEAWVPVAFAMVIVIGVVGGSLAQMVLKEMLPLLRELGEQRRQQAVSAPDIQRVTELLESLDTRLQRIEADHRRLQQDREFSRQLLHPPERDTE